MTLPVWENLLGAVVDGRFRLRTLTYAGRDQAEYTADDVAQPHGGAALVTLIAPSLEHAGQLRADLMRAASLDHPHLLRIHGAGDATVGGISVLHLASETPDETLSDRLRAGPLAAPDILRLLSHLVAALRYLHGRGLAYRSLEPGTVVRVGALWKLADFGRMHAIGGNEPCVPPSLDGSRYIPPEAYDGRALAASDVWALGVLMTEIIAGTTDPVMLPEPFGRVCLACAERDPRRRPSLDEIAAALNLPPADAPPAVLKPVAAPAASPAPQRSTPSRAPKSAARVLVPALAVVAAAALWIRGANDTPSQSPPVVQAPKPAAAKPKPAPAKPKVEAPRPAQPVRTPSTDTPEENGARRVLSGKADIAAGMDGRRTASGDKFDSGSLTAAHPTLPFGTRLRVTNLANGRSVVVTVNDRGGFRRGYLVRLTRRAARELGFTRSGSATVAVEIIK